MSAEAKGRRIMRIVDGVRTLEGGGFSVRRPFPGQAVSEIDPFLLLDEMGPTDYPPGEAKGAPDHPHRGFETVTYMLSGQMMHRDSQGFSGTLGPGDVQWMTAGAGVVHSEMPAPDLLDNGGLMHGLQLWVNLPKRDKMIRPRYQDIPSKKIPIVTLPDGKSTVKVIAGSSHGAQAVIDTRTPIQYLHFVLRPGASVTQPVPKEHNGFLYTISGEGVAGAQAERLREGQMGTLSMDSDVLHLAVPKTAKAAWSVLLITGVPLVEPVVRWGPFVMNDWSEIRDAVADFQAGRMGTIEPIGAKR